MSSDPILGKWVNPPIIIIIIIVIIIIIIIIFGNFLLKDLMVVVWCDWLYFGQESDVALGLSIQCSYSVAWSSHFL